MVGSTELGSTRVPGISGGAPGTPTDGIPTVPIDAISPADVVRSWRAAAPSRVRGIAGGPEGIPGGAPGAPTDGIATVPLTALPGIAGGPGGIAGGPGIAGGALPLAGICMVPSELAAGALPGGAGGLSSATDRV